MEVIITNTWCEQAIYGKGEYEYIEELHIESHSNSFWQKMIPVITFKLCITVLKQFIKKHAHALELIYCIELAYLHQEKKKSSSVCHTQIGKTWNQLERVIRQTDIFP